MSYFWPITIRTCVTMRQLNFAAFSFAWMFFYAITSVVVSDDNAIIELAFKNYYKAINISGKYNFVNKCSLLCERYNILFMHLSLYCMHKAWRCASAIKTAILSG